MSLIYCYGVVEENVDMNWLGLESGRIHLIPFKDIIAVVSEVSEEKFSQEAIDKDIKDMKWLTENGQIHEAVVDSVMQKTTIIPMKFCTIFKTKETLINMLEEKYADIKFNLSNLKDKVEIGVKVYFDTSKLKEKIKQESDELKELEQEADKKKPGAAYFDKQKIDILLREKVQQRLAKDGKDIFEKIKVRAIDSKQNDLLNKKVTNKDMLLNAVFLIDKSELDEFKAGVDNIKSTFPSMEFEIWGPFPAYNFIR